jgi:HAD superfamily hydrolase (TIGR01509 family)
MLRGVIFDLGSTLVSHEYYNRWPDLRPKMIEALAADLRQQGLSLDNAAFGDAFSRNFYDFDSQRQTHFKEITSEYTLRATLDALKFSPDRIDFPRALAAFFAPSEALWTPMPGVYTTLDTLRERGLKLAIVSNAADNANVQRMIDNANLRPYFDPIVVSAAAGIRKPNPLIFQPVLAAWGIPPAEIAMVGDTLGADVLGAQHIGMKSVWVTMEADTPANIAHKDTILPDAVIESLDKLPSILDRF